jgi:hypothetical protein
MVLDHYKWDPQVGDTSTRADFPLVVPCSTWQQLASWAEPLTAADVPGGYAEALRVHCLQPSQIDWQCNQPRLGERLLGALVAP